MEETTVSELEEIFDDIYSSVDSVKREVQNLKKKLEDYDVVLQLKREVDIIISHLNGFISDLHKTIEKEKADLLD